MCGERPAVHGEDPDRDAGGRGGQPSGGPRPSSCSRGGCPVAPAQQPYELEEAGQVPPGADGAADVPERDEPDAGFLGCRAKRSGPVGCDDDVEALDEDGQERRDVRLGPADLGQRDQ